MQAKDNPNTDPQSQPQTDPNTAPEKKAPKRHLIRSPWLRIPLKVLGCLILLILLIPVLLYLPPVQNLAVKTATKMVSDKTGMKIGIDKLRLKFPVNLSLSGVSVIEATGDTMVLAREAIVDVKLRPLLGLDVRIKKLKLRDGYYRMLSPDSSMLMTIKAGLLEVDDKSSANIKTSTISLNEAKLQNGEVLLNMDVWKQKPTPQDTTSTPFYITAKKLNIENMTFLMMMLPTIDTLKFQTSKLTLDDGVIDLRTNSIRMADVTASHGDALMLAPSLEYVKEHPAPAPDSTAAPSAPTTVVADRITLTDFNARYAVKDSPVVSGFDANDIRVSGLDIELENFYNQATTISLPITYLKGTEQCGLTITEGKGTFSMDSVGMMLKDFDIRTPFSHLEATAAIPNALLTFQPEALLDVNLNASLGMSDINSFMPDLATYTKVIPSLTPLNAAIKANGELGNADIEQFDIALPGTLSLRATGKAQNALDFKNLIANLTFDGELRRPEIIKKFVALDGVNIPTLAIKGTASANRENYAADFKLTTPQGNLAADGHVGMNSERYDVRAAVHSLNVGYFIGDKTIGPVTASLTAQGVSFNPEKHGAHTDVHLDLTSALYNGHNIKDITLLATLRDEYFTLKANSPNPVLSFDIEGNGRISDNFYQADLTADLRHVDLKALGLSDSTNNGAGKIHVSGTASPHTWLYNVGIAADDVNWHLPGQDIVIPDSVHLKFVSTADNTDCRILADGATVRFLSSVGLKPLIDGFTKVSAIMPKMIEDKRIDVEALEQKLPPFSLSADVDGKGVASTFLQPTGMSFKDFSLRLDKDSIISGNMALDALNTGSMRLDTITASLNSRGQLLDYIVHLGNRPGTFDEFANVRLSGYLGENRLSAYLVQHNIKKQMGYRLGFTASLADSIMSIRFTPLKATIAYLPWTFNLDNYIDFNILSRKLQANLQASSDKSSILLRSEKNEKGQDNLHLNLKDIQVEDFLHMMLNPPPVKALVNSDINVRYTGKALVGKGSLDIGDLVFDRKRVGDFNFTMAAGMGNKGKSAGKVGLMVNGAEAAAVQFILAPDSLNPGGGLIAERLKLILTKFPLSIANPFFPPHTMNLSGALNGSMNLSGSFTAPLLNGNIACDSVGLFFNMLGTKFKFGQDSITVKDNVLDFHEFDIYGVNKNPLTLRGTVDATKMTDMKFDLSAKAVNMQLVGGNSRSADVTGKLFVDLDASVKGPMSFMDINAVLNVLPATDVNYNMAMTSDAISQGTGADGVVKFVNFNDSIQVAEADSLTSTMGMRITAKAILSQGMQVTVNLGDQGKVECNPSGTLNYFQNYVGDMKLTGTLYTGTGYANYSIPLIGKKNFDFDQNSHITWSGNIMNPALSIKATDQVKASIQMNGNTNLVNFLVTLNIGNTLSAPSVVFDLSTDDDMSISNELQSMTADQRMQQAMNLLLTGRYAGPSAKSVGSNFATSSLFSFLSSQLNSFLANNVKGVDINLGVNQYETGTNGNTNTNTSYSYQVSKSLLNNRFKIIVGGNYSTDASSDENFQQNLISDIAFEYILKQTNSMSLNARLFRHTGFESVLEGEVTETGVGLSLRRRLAFFTEITHFGLSRYFKEKWKNYKEKRALSSPADSLSEAASAEEIPADSLKAIPKKEEENEK
ncbi:MAG: translocation/assembly module TamB domain-containing protein [Muribaculaceae bacterium]|nr:translocation/assembly module TamB domain-containing protein [Muribaculaceae bacterium]